MEKQIKPKSEKQMQIHENVCHDVCSRKIDHMQPFVFKEKWRKEIQISLEMWSLIKRFKESMLTF